MKAVIIAPSHDPHQQRPFCPSLLLLANKPLIRHQLRAIRKAGITEAVIAFRCPELADYFRHHSNEGVSVLFDRPMALREPAVVLRADVLPFGSLVKPAGSRPPDADDGMLTVNTADDYLAASAMVLGRVAADPQDLTEVMDGVWADWPVFIDPAATITGPVVLGRNCSIAAGATIVGPCVLGHAAMVCRNALVRNSIILPGAAIGANARVASSIIGECFTIGPGAVFDRCIAIDGASPAAALPLDQGSLAIEHSPRGRLLAGRMMND
ncbi:MAG TPA: NDP-sugar synthase [Planctomycetota bacterium]|nr:NDP-sugar synthase [Planctomycetota bacterium]